MISPVHEAVLEAANRVAAVNGGTFTPDEVVRALPHLNENTVRTHIVSRCCVGAPKHHATVWGYFRRVSRGRYRVEPKYRREPGARGQAAAGADAAQSRLVQTGKGGVGTEKRATIHAVIQRGATAYVAECLEVPVVTQGNTLDEVVDNLQQALALHLEGEDLSALGLANAPRLQLTYDTVLAS